MIRNEVGLSVFEFGTFSGMDNQRFEACGIAGEVLNSCKTELEDGLKNCCLFYIDKGNCV